MRATLVSLTLLAACAADPEQPTTFDDTRIDQLIESGALQLDLSAAEDPSVLADAKDLVARSLDLTPELALGKGRAMKLRYLGKGKVAPDISDIRPEQPESTAAPDDSAVSFDAFNPATGNEFRLELPSAGVTAMRETAAALGTDGSSFVAEEREPSFAWSNNDDDRYRMYGLNAPVTNVVHRPLVRFGDTANSGCTGTMIGPRHVLTAGHCLWSKKNSSWGVGLVRVGRNGTSWIGSVNANDPIPPGQSLWYWTPSQFRTNDNTDGYDIGILVIPSRMGEQSGWMGRVALGGAQLADRDVIRRGYPACDVDDRIDDPSPCSPHHLYGNQAYCELGDYANPDADGWSRTVRHSCDASASDSGSPLYVISNEGDGAVTAVHTTSLCGTRNDNACSAAMTDRPLRATRITPEYLGWISYFRSTFP